MNKPDWSKAPEGATHWNGDLPCPWLRENSVSYWNYVEWMRYPNKDIGKRHLSEAIPRPPKKQKKHERIAELLAGSTISGLTKSKANELCRYLDEDTTLIVDTSEVQS